MGSLDVSISGEDEDDGVIGGRYISSIITLRILLDHRIHLAYCLCEIAQQQSDFPIFFCFFTTAQLRILWGGLLNENETRPGPSRLMREMRVRAERPELYCERKYSVHTRGLLPIEAGNGMDHWTANLRR